MMTLHRTAIRPGDIILHDGERRRVTGSDNGWAHLQGLGWVELPLSVHVDPYPQEES